MRLWSIHPANLDRVGLIALWRETLLAIAVLEGKTKGYKHHPQLERFRHQPIDVIYYYAWNVAKEMIKRGYKPDTSKLKPLTSLSRLEPIKVSVGQLSYEHALVSLKMVNRRKPTHDARIKVMFSNPCFWVDWEDETIATWERRPK